MPHEDTGGEPSFRDKLRATASGSPLPRESTAPVPLSKDDFFRNLRRDAPSELTWEHVAGLIEADSADWNRPSGNPPRNAAQHRSELRALLDIASLLQTQQSVDGFSINRLLTYLSTTRTELIQKNPDDPIARALRTLIVRNSNS